MESYEAITYKLQGIGKSRHQAMVHFKQFVNLMEAGDQFEGTIEILIRFINSDGSDDKWLADSYSVPETVIPLFISRDDSGFSMVHGVYAMHGGAWDSES